MSEGDATENSTAAPAAPDTPDAPEIDLDEVEIRLETAPFDPRFPNQNQAKHCYSSFIDYHRCVRLRGESFAPCQYFQRVYKSICPNAWVAKWETQLDNGTFAGPL